MGSEKKGWDHSQIRKYDISLEQIPRLDYQDPKIDELMAENKETPKKYTQHTHRDIFERKRAILLLVASFLREQNLTNTLKCLETEADPIISGYELCDNVDLDSILQEFMSYHYTKFNKVPKIIKQLEQIQTGTKKGRSQNILETKQPKTNVIKCEQDTKSDNKQFDFQIKRILSTDPDSEVKREYNRVQMPALCLTYSKEWQELADAVKKEIIDDYSGTSWKDCIGLEKPQQLLKESVIYPIMYPHLFTGLTRPWKGILLYGPPGTGKTLLAKAVACESSMTFINLTSSTFVSKWRGESEKMIKVLFDLAKLEAPTTIFIDEIDAVFCQGNGSNQDASRRFRCELLIQMDGLLQGNESIFVLASTNKPWDLDAALLRRFEKRILINLPNQENRYELFKYFLKNCMHCIDEQVLKKASEMTSLFSGSDVKLACKEACMKNIRNALRKIEVSDTFSNKAEISAPSVEDIFNAIQTTNPLTDKQLLNKYLEWNKRFGSC